MHFVGITQSTMRLRARAKRKNPRAIFFLTKREKQEDMEKTNGENGGKNRASGIEAT